MGRIAQAPHKLEYVTSGDRDYERIRCRLRMMNNKLGRSSRSDPSESGSDLQLVLHPLTQSHFDHTQASPLPIWFIAKLNIGLLTLGWA